MWAVAITFALVLAIFLGLYWAVMVRPEDAARKALQDRLRARPSVSDQAIDIIARAKSLSEVALVHRILAGTGRLPFKLQEQLELAGLKWTVGTFLVISLLAAVAVFALLTYLKTGLPLAAGASLLALFVPYFVVKNFVARRMQRFEELFPEAIDLLARALRAGHAFTTGLSMVAEEVTDPVGPEFRRLYDQQNFGMPLPEALRTFAHRIPLLDARFFVTAVLTQREAGGNLAEVLDNLSSVIRDRFKLKRHVRVVTAHQRITAWLLICLPIVAALWMLIIDPQHIVFLVTHPTGIRMLVAAVALQIIGSLIIRRLVNFDY